MKKNRIVIALGGNALGHTPEEQKKKAAACAEVLAELIEKGCELVLVHGNGPQVGMIQLGLSHAAADGVIEADMPLAECTALSQGYIGFHLQNALQDALRRRSVSREVVTLLTQVEVDPDDPAFAEPTKPVGAYYPQGEAEKLGKQKGWTMKEFARRGWRRVVASPKPIDILEKGPILRLTEQGTVVIAVGGGGIPVIRTADGYESVPAVIDKDLASEKLAELVDAEQFIILTAVPQVSIHYAKPDQINLRSLSAEQARTYMETGEFAAGSMLPKVQAAVSFAESGEGRRAVIGQLEQALACVKGEAGTEIIR